MIHREEEGLVGRVVVDFELLKIEVRIPGLNLCDKRFYRITVAAPFTVEKIPGYGSVRCGRKRGGGGGECTR